MDDGAGESSDAHVHTRDERERIRLRLIDLSAERDRLDQRGREVTEELHRLLRDAHDLGWSWAEVAEMAGYRNAAVARNQALPRTAHPAAPSQTVGYSVREAADRLGVTPQAIYAWIRAGRIQVADDRARGRRVYLPPDSESVS